MAHVLRLIGLYSLGMLAGASLVVQSGINAQLRVYWNSAYWAAFLSYLGGTIVMLVVLAVTKNYFPEPGVLARTPLSSYAGGFFGAVYIVILILLLPRIGAASVFSLLVAGQMVASLLCDHFLRFHYNNRGATKAKNPPIE